MRKECVGHQRIKNPKSTVRTNLVNILGARVVQHCFTCHGNSKIHEIILYLMIELVMTAKPLICAITLQLHKVLRKSQICT